MYLNLAITIATSVICMGCASKPPIVEDDAMNHMSRQEVINAVQECEDNEMRPQIMYTRDKWRNKSVVVPIDVQCTPLPYHIKAALRSVR